jgi:hypothetical protein
MFFEGLLVAVVLLTYVTVRDVLRRRLERLAARTA